MPTGSTALRRRVPLPRALPRQPLQRPALPGGIPPVPVSAPAARFAAAVAARPLDRPRRLPVEVAPWASALAPRTPVRYTTGAATRAALRAAAAEAATTGSVLHLPAPPTLAPRSLELLTHELVHAAGAGKGPDPQTQRPAAFLLRSLAQGALDQTERRARTAGAAAREAVSRSPVPSTAREAVRALGGAPRRAPAAMLGDRPAALGRSLADRARSTVPADPARSAREAVSGVTELPVVPALSGAVAAARHAAPASVDEARSRTAAVRAGGEQAAREAVGSLLGPLPVPRGLPAVPRRLPAGIAEGVERGRSAVGDLGASADAAVTRAGGALEDVAQRVAGVPEAAQRAGGLLDAAQQRAGGLRDAAQQSAGGLLDRASEAVDPDAGVGRLLEAVEDRVLLELERRGGRYAGLF